MILEGRYRNSRAYYVAHRIPAIDIKMSKTLAGQTSPIVSVIIPTYNREAFLREAIASVQSQTMQDFELLVIDDGSTDGTDELGAALGESVRYFYQPNRGVSAARNAGITRARGALIAFLDSDDLWQPNKLAHQVAWLQAHPDIMLCHTNEIWLRDGRQLNQKRHHRKSGGWIYPLCLPRCVISPSAVMIRKALLEMVGCFDENLPVCEDYDLWLRITSRFEVGFIDEPLIVKRGGHADQLSRREWGIDRFRVTALMKILARGRLHDNWQQQTVNELIKKCTILAEGCRKRDKREEARGYEEIISQAAALRANSFCKERVPGSAGKTPAYGLG